VRGTVTGQKATGAFMKLKSPADTALVAVASPVAKIVEIHEMKMEGGMMKMSAIDKLPLPAGKTVDLKAGGYHVMLMDLTQELKDGQTVPVTLTFEDKAGKKTTVDVKAAVKPLAPGAHTAKCSPLGGSGRARSDWRLSANFREQALDHASACRGSPEQIEMNKH
jgi:copper(I)-binding protein